MLFTKIKPAAALLSAAIALACANSAFALNFNFSFANVEGAQNGILTGTIYGLNDNSTGAASKLTIDSFPSGVGSLDYGNEVTLWNGQYLNNFTVLNGEIVAGSFVAQATGGSALAHTFCLDAFINCVGFTANPGSTGVSALNLQLGSNIANGAGFQAITYTPVSSVPLPAGGLLLVSGLGGMALVKRRKKETV